MVSIRGMKFKFAVGEKVLCYEPDPTKAKVLYDSKILGLSAGHDVRGRKVPEYLIHFHGWSNSWDRCVKETLILRDTEENRNLQIKLADVAAALLKGKKKQPPVIRNSLAKREIKIEEPDSASNSDDASTCSESSEGVQVVSQEKSQEVVEMPIPPLLCRILQQDRTFITRKHKLIKLPCEAPIVSVLEEFVKSECVRLMYSSQPKRAKSGKGVSSETMETKFQLFQEFVDGVRIFIDFTLPTTLLYNQEQEQYDTIARTAVPIGRMRSEGFRIPKKEPVDILSPTVILNLESPRFPTSPREQAADGGGATSTISPKSQAAGHSQQRVPKVAKPGPRQGLRSSDKPRGMDEAYCGIPSSSLETSEQNLESSSSTLNSPPRKTRQASSRSPMPLHQPALSPAGSSSAHSPNSIASLSAIALSNQPVVTIQPLPAISVSNLSSSGSSTHSSSSCLKDRKPPIFEANYSKLLKEVLEWKLLPDHLYAQIPAGASLIYGPHHLLRLFVELPEMLRKMNMERWKLQQILQLSNVLLNFLSQRKDEYFPTSSYVDAQEQLNARH